MQLRFANALAGESFQVPWRYYWLSSGACDSLAQFDIMCLVILQNMQDFEEAQYLSGSRRLFAPNMTAVTGFLEVSLPPGLTMCCIGRVFTRHNKSGIRMFLMFPFCFYFAAHATRADPCDVGLEKLRRQNRQKGEVV